MRADRAAADACGPGVPRTNTSTAWPAVCSPAPQRLACSPSPCRPFGLCPVLTSGASPRTSAWVFGHVPR